MMYILDMPLEIFKQNLHVRATSYADMFVPKSYVLFTKMPDGGLE